MTTIQNNPPTLASVDPARGGITTSGVLTFLYGALAYVFFLAAFLYLIGFVSNLLVPKSIDSGRVGPIGQAVVVNLLLISLFGVQHCIMARPGFKVRWTRLIPRAAERSTFVLATCAILGLMYWQWRPMPATVWQVDGPTVQSVLWAIAAAGWLMVLYSTFLINHFDLFGLRQVTLRLLGQRYTHLRFSERSLYRVVRHPLMLGFIIAFWSTPHMTAGHLLFAAAFTAFILIALVLEERDLVALLGEDYQQYRQRTPKLMPNPWHRRRHLH